MFGTAVRFSIAPGAKHGVYKPESEPGPRYSIMILGFLSTLVVYNC